MEKDTYNIAEASSKKIPKKLLYWAAALVFVLLVGLNIYFFNKLNNTQQPQQLTSEVSELQIQEFEEEKNQLQLEYNAALVKLDALNTDNREIRNNLKQQETELTAARAKIESLLKKDNITLRNLQTARELITLLNIKLQDYEKEIAQLKAINQNLRQERDNVIDKNTVLTTQIELAKVLSAGNIKMTAISLRKGGAKEKETIKARRVDLLRITFDVITNQVIESGSQKLYLCIYGPDETMISDDNFGSGTFQLQDEQVKNYTISKDVHLEQGKGLNGIYIDWNKPSEYAKGTYKLEIFHKGFLIGESSVVLK